LNNHKVSQNHFKLPIVVIACQVFESMLNRMLSPEIYEQLTFLDYGLHSNPKQMTIALQEVIDQIEEPSLVVLGYGLCGNGINGLQSRQHVILVPRADDCIAMFFGSYQSFKEDFDSNPGTYYLSKGWLESGSDPLLEHQGLVEKYGTETADWIMEQQYQHYKRLVYVALPDEKESEFKQRMDAVAAYCERFGMQYEVAQGSDHYIEQLFEAITQLNHSTDDFVLVPPGAELQQRQFLRLDYSSSKSY
jgi:hypothetical protein